MLRSHRRQDKSPRARDSANAAGRPTTSLVDAESDELFTVFLGPVFTAGQAVPSVNELVPLVFYVRDDGETGGMVAARRRRVLELQAPALDGDRGYQDAAQRDPRGGQHLESVQKARRAVGSRVPGREAGKLTGGGHRLQSCRRRDP